MAEAWELAVRRYECALLYTGHSGTGVRLVELVFLRREGGLVCQKCAAALLVEAVETALSPQPSTEIVDEALLDIQKRALSLVGEFARKGKHVCEEKIDGDQSHGRTA